ncbi:MAG TPA: c-type cytochrome, partial [Saprospiraceae bacterium]|nr:c-type cytochrome [Saprospiraceae bacterium]
DRMNMKKTGISCLILLAFFALHCGSKRNPYNLSTEMSMEERKKAVRYLDQGRDLYKQHCSVCHGIYGKGNDQAPDFTKHQLEMYSAKLKMQDEVNHQVAGQLNYAQVECILNFLTRRNEAAKK